MLAREGGDIAKILSSPAIGDLEGDGSPEIIEGTAEAYGSTPATNGRVYAFKADGTRVPGWPVSPPALSADSIPLVGEGVPVSPALADVDGDGDDEVAVAAFTGTPQLYDGDGGEIGGAGAQGHFQTEGRGPPRPRAHRRRSRSAPTRPSGERRPAGRCGSSAASSTCGWPRRSSRPRPRSSSST